jgi:hypothetical protein
MNDTNYTSSPWIVQPEAGREGINLADAQAELVPSPASAGSKLPGTELVPSPPELGANSQAGVSSLPPQQKPHPEKPSPNDEALPALPLPVKPRFSEGGIPQTIEALIGVIRERGLRFRWAWREDLGSGNSDDVSCVVIVENAPEFDALCMQYQDHLQTVVPFNDDECLGSAFGID